MSAARRTLYVDPGQKCTGLSFFIGETLSAVHAVRAKSLEGACLGAAHFGATLTQWCPRKVVIELPQIYAAGVQKADPNDIVALGAIAGAYAGVAGREGARWLRPAEWKGQTPKDIVHSRMVDVLTLEECKLFDGLKIPRGLVNNVWDAVSMGLVDLGRMK